MSADIWEHVLLPWNYDYDYETSKGEYSSENSEAQTL
jgi:hypothetical protein